MSSNGWDKSVEKTRREARDKSIYSGGKQEIELLHGRSTPPAAGGDAAVHPTLYCMEIINGREHTDGIV